jgi:sterol desaturase/sphingolipid hydroxylase (fatty acid hydroxylase superfamily)
MHAGIGVAILLVPINYATAAVWLSFGIITSCLGHTRGYDILQHLNDTNNAASHKVHHHQWQYNYGFIFPYWDRHFGTRKEPKL